MSLLSHNQLKKLVSQRVITNVEQDQINSTSIDLTLGCYILLEHGKKRTISFRQREPLYTVKYDLDEQGFFDLHPGEFILAQSEQVFNLPLHISAEYKLKSSMARIGLEHLNAGWCDAGWNGSVLTLELKNMTQRHTIRLQRGDRIGQIVFFEHEAVPRNKSYAVRGRYNGDKEVHGMKL